MSDFDTDYYPADNPEPYYEHEDTGWGTCPDCGSYLENWGATSDGDGDLYDELGCPNCQEPVGQHNLHYYDDFYNEFDSYDDYLQHGHFDDEPESVSLKYHLDHLFDHFIYSPLMRIIYDLRHIDVTYRIRRCRDCGKRGVVRGERYCRDCRIPF